MNQLYYKIMQEKTNKELVRLIYFDRNNFHHEGVSVAEEEIKRREVSELEITTWKKEIEQDIISEQKSAQLPLELSNKILSLFLPGAVPFVLSKKYEENGMINKARELRQWSVYGFIMYSILVVALLFLVMK
jgi:hypothetical protein